MKKWYVVYTKPQAESHAEQHLHNQGFETFLPRFRATRSHMRKRETILKPLFPRYIFVHLDSERQRWRAINSTLGVLHLVCEADMPLPVSDRVIHEIKSRRDDDGIVVITPHIHLGDTVEVMEGPFQGLWGKIAQMSDNERSMLLLSMMGGQVKVKIENTKLRRVS